LAHGFKGFNLGCVAGAPGQIIMAAGAFGGGPFSDVVDKKQRETHTKRVQEQDPPSSSPVTSFLHLGLFYFHNPTPKLAPATGDKTFNT
jgi:hypothetical protein